ncbi:hypothetical protein ACH5RR_026529 [Cinchona calisaya]|uniref:Acyl-[acyl-carrier-protein] desaturase n=1 Tax=Cinchona calisaya TaxID=153742 RepID=A0ABD2Z6S9_9GENT
MQTFALPRSITTTTQNHPTTATFQRPPVVSATAATPLQHLHTQTTYSVAPEKTEVFKSLEHWATQRVLPLLKPVEKCWQPIEFLPDPSKLSVDEFTDQVRGLQERTAGLPDEYFVVLVGDMITEDALPTYQSWMNTHEGVRDETGASPSPWAVWTRGWTAEENRHGDLLKNYLYLSGRVDMLMIEKTVQYLIGAGADVGTANDPYFGFVYTSFQERATFVSHGNTAKLAKEGGDPVLARICGTIASDERRHEIAYSRIVEKLLEVDPNGAMMAISEMMRKKITMPAHLMYDGLYPDLFERFAAMAQKIGVYTANDYADILEFFIGLWNLEKLQGLTGEARRSQAFVCGLPRRIRKFQERADDRARKLQPRRVNFSWIFNKELTI